MKLPVSAIVCTFNEEKRIKACIESLLRNDVSEIICVDGDSTDSTVSIAKASGAIVLSDSKRGLTVASQMGAEKATSEYIFFVGPDNIIPEGAVASLIKEMARLGYAGISPLTSYVPENNNYISKALTTYRKLKFKPGPSTVIGTPSLYKRAVFLKYGFDLNQRYNGDSNLGERMIRDGLKLGRVGISVQEHGYDDIFSVIKRWKMYGICNYEFYRRFAPEWSAARKLRSILHPINSEVLYFYGSKDISFSDKLNLSPFLILITMCRYYGWLASAINDRLSAKRRGSYAK